MYELVDAIVGGEFPEGKRLPSLADLCGRLGAGRDVVREAMRGLEDRGLITIRAGRGQYVRTRDRWDSRAPDVFRSWIAHGPDAKLLLEQTLDARTVVEREAATRACTVATDADLTLLRDHVAEMQRALEPGVTRTFDDQDPLVSAEAWFHRTLALLSGNDVLARLVEPLHLPLAELRRQRTPERDRTVILHHRRIVEGLSSRDASLAREAVEHHARQLWRWL